MKQYWKTMTLHCPECGCIITLPQHKHDNKILCMCKPHTHFIDGDGIA